MADKKETFYFAHDYEPTSDPKIQALIGNYGAIGYGVYWRVIEMLHSDPTHRLPIKNYIFEAIAKQMLTNASEIQKLLTDCIENYELFEANSTHLWCNRVDRNIATRLAISEKRSAAGKIGGKGRSTQKNTEIAFDKDLETNEIEAIAKQMLAKKRKGKESKEKKIVNNTENISGDFDKFWDLYDKKIDRPKCEGLWQKITADEKNKIFSTIPAYLKSLSDKQFQKNPATYLHNKAWNNEIVVYQQFTKSNPQQPAKEKKYTNL